MNIPEQIEARNQEWVRHCLSRWNDTSLVVLFSATTLLPPVINPVLDPVVVIIIGATALAIRYYLKKNTGLLEVYPSKKIN